MVTLSESAVRGRLTRALRQGSVCLDGWPTWTALEAADMPRLARLRATLDVPDEMGDRALHRVVTEYAAGLRARRRERYRLASRCVELDPA